MSRILFPIHRKDPALVRFFLLAFSISWVFWIPAAFFDSASLEPLVFVLYLIGGFGPTVAGLIMISRTITAEGQQDIFRRLIDLRRIGWKWSVIILMIFPFIGWSTMLTYRLFHGSNPLLPALQGFTGKPGDYLTLFFIALQVMIMGPLAEEIGWRGFALDRFLASRQIIPAGFILGVIWGIWHIPLFFISGSMYYEWGFGTGLFWLFLLRMTALSVLMTVVYSRTKRSILSAILIHFMFNFTFGFLQPSPAEIHISGTLLLTAFSFLISLKFLKILM